MNLSFPSALNRVVLLFAALETFARAEPLVSGFERFHEKAGSAEGGRLLFNELGCVNCHSTQTGLPERRGAVLGGIASRAQAAWVEAFLVDPQKHRPGTTMPLLLADSSPEDRAAILSFLASIPGGVLKAKTPRHVNASRGRHVFHSVGCVSCHAPDPNYPLAEAPAVNEFRYQPVSFPQLAHKYSLTALADFLKDPLHRRPDGRMPKIAMSETDAIDVAGYLIGFQGSNGELATPIKPWTSDAALSERGRALVKSARCGACHELPKEVLPSKVPIQNLERGCLSKVTAPGVPNYSLSETQRLALRLFLKNATDPFLEAQAVELTLQALNCVACHERKGEGGPDPARKAYFLGDQNLGDTGRYPPPLTGVGRKLRLDWMEKVLWGENRVRAYLQTKMPIYGKATADLAGALARVDGQTEKTFSSEDDAAGRKLLGTQGGLGCITCHRWGERASLGIQALDLSSLGQRLRVEWLREYLVDPAHYRPGTLMPSFWPGGMASNREILGGNTDAQIAAIYSFAKSANGEPEGFPQTANGEYELVPKDRPIVQRTFMEEAGTHAILVGFPSGTHLAFDGRRGRPVLAWRGKFFDAYNTWFSRFAPFEKVPTALLARWKVSAMPAIAESMVCDGYELDATGNPTFLVRLGEGRVRDRYEGVEGGLRRTVEMNGGPASAFELTHPDSGTVREEMAGDAKRRQFIYLWK